jgi:hypothetical protein
VGEDRLVPRHAVLLGPEAVELAWVDLERVALAGLDEGRDERHRVGEVDVVVGRAVDEEQIGLDRAAFAGRDHLVTGFPSGVPMYRSV